MPWYGLLSVFLPECSGVCFFTAKKRERVRVNHEEQECSAEASKGIEE